MTEKPELSDGYGRIANEIMDVLARTYMSSYESQFLWCLFRRTYGWGQKDNFISLSEIATCTGMHKSHVSRTKSKLIHRRIVTQTGNIVSFNKYHSQWRQLPRQVTVTRTGNTNTPPPIQVTNPPPVQVISPYKENKRNNTKERREQSSLTPSDQNELFFSDETVRQKAIEFFTSRGAGANQVRAEIEKFVSYWTEPNKSGTSVAWKMKKTFDVKRRLVTWMNRSMQYNTARSHSTPEI